MKCGFSNIHQSKQWSGEAGNAANTAKTISSEERFMR